MHNAASMRVVERHRDLEHDAHHAMHRQQLVHGHELIQAGAFYQFHDQVSTLVLYVPVEHPRDVRMVELCRDRSLGGEKLAKPARQLAAVIGEIHHLDRDTARRAGIAVPVLAECIRPAAPDVLLREVDRRGRAAADLLDGAILPEPQIADIVCILHPVKVPAFRSGCPARIAATMFFAQAHGYSRASLHRG